MFVLRSKNCLKRISRKRNAVSSTEDAMKGIAWRDDSQCVIQLGEKLYSPANVTGVLIDIEQLQGNGNGR